jgi:response regulator RpfG family c-di-GMP phosphodiesterase
MHEVDVNSELAAEQALRYAEELRELYLGERAQRQRAEDALRELEGSYGATVRALAAALELRDDLTGGHAERVTDLALRLTERIAPGLAADPELEYGFLLHDIGKIGVPDAILLKAGPLEAKERTVMERHPLHGARGSWSRSRTSVASPARSSSPTTSAGTAAGTRTEAPARLSRWPLASSRSSTRSTR